MFCYLKRYKNSVFKIKNLKYYDYIYSRYKNSKLFNTLYKSNTKHNFKKILIQPLYVLIWLSKLVLQFDSNIMLFHLKTFSDYKWLLKLNLV